MKQIYLLFRGFVGISDELDVLFSSTLFTFFIVSFRDKILKEKL